MISRFLLSCIFLPAISFLGIAQANDPMKPDADTSGQEIFEKVEVEASFPGGEMAWKKFLERNLRADAATENGAPAGIYTVWIQFVVDKDGSVTDIRPLTKWGYGMETEVVRIIRIGPQWQPATQNGKVVKAYRKQPVTFMIEEDGLEVYPTHYNALFIGMDSPLTITATKVKDKNLRLTISQGTITGRDGIYMARVTTEGRAIIEVYSKNKKIGAVSLEVRQGPSLFDKMIRR